MVAGRNHFSLARLRQETRRRALGDQVARTLLGSQMQPLESVLLLDKVGQVLAPCRAEPVACHWDAMR
jgi:hypothetical protein